VLSFKEKLIMPLYSFKNKETGEVFEKQMTIADRETFLQNNPDIQQILTKAPSLGDSVRLGIHRHSDGFNDVLKNIKSHHRHSTIETR
jgi:hypothetical protein